MFIWQLQLWSKLELEVKYSNSKFCTRLADITDSGILVTTPVNEGEVLRPIKGSSVRIVSIVNGELYKWTGIFKDYEIINNIMLHTIECVEHGRGFNRREEFRVPFIQYGKVKTEGKEKNITTRDISYTGIGFISLLKAEIGDKLSLEIYNDNEEFKLDVVVMRVNPVKSSEYSYGCTIVNTDMDMGSLIYKLQTKKRAK